MHVRYCCVAAFSPEHLHVYTNTRPNFTACDLLCVVPTLTGTTLHYIFQSFSDKMTGEIIQEIKLDKQSK